jgi:hypothetical protein
VTDVAAAVQAFFTPRLISQRRGSPDTIAANRDAIRMLLQFAGGRTATPLARLDLTRPQRDHGHRVPGPPGTRTDQQHPQPQRPPRRHPLRVRVRRAAPPEHSNDIARVLAIPAKRTDHPIIEFLTDDEVDEPLNGLTPHPQRPTLSCCTWLSKQDYGHPNSPAGFAATSTSAPDPRQAPGQGTQETRHPRSPPRPSTLSERG